MENNNHKCPFCNQDNVFYEVEKTKTLIKYSCANCGCKRQESNPDYVRPKLDYPKENYFHIFTPFYGAWVAYGWGKGDWGIGLNKDKIDKKSDTETIYVSYGKDENTKYKIPALEVKKFPQRRVRDTDVFLYIVPKSKLVKM